MKPVKRWEVQSVAVLKSEDDGDYIDSTEHEHDAYSAAESAVAEHWASDQGPLPQGMIVKVRECDTAEMLELNLWSHISVSGEATIDWRSKDDS